MVFGLGFGSSPPSGGGASGSHTASYGASGGRSGGGRSADRGSYGSAGYQGSGGYGGYGGSGYPSGYGSGYAGGGYGGGFYERRVPDITDQIAKEEEEAISATFKKWDTKGNNVITKKELKYVLTQLGVDKSQVSAIFQEVDYNYDGKVDWREFVYWLYKGKTAPATLKQQALAPSYKVKVERVELDLTDASASITPCVKWRDLFMNQVISETPDGRGPKCSMDLRSGEPPVIFDISSDSRRAVGCEVCVGRFMRSDAVIAYGELELATAIRSMASSSGGPQEVKVQLFKDNTYEGKKKPAGVLTLQIKEFKSNDIVWAKAKVETWQKSGLPKLETFNEVNAILETLLLAPDHKLEMSACKTVDLMVQQNLDGMEKWSKEDAVQKLASLSDYVCQIHSTLTRTRDAYSSGARELTVIKEKIVTQTLTWALSSEPLDYKRMKLALGTAQKLDPQNLKKGEVERQFKALLKFPEFVKMDDLMVANDNDLVQMQPRTDKGLTLESDAAEPPSCDDHTRWAVRDETAQRVLTLLGCPDRIHFSLGLSYERLAAETIAVPEFKMPELVSRLMSKSVVFRGEKEAKTMTYSELMKYRQRDIEALLGRFDVVAVPVCGEYDRDFKSLVQSGEIPCYFGEKDDQPIGGPGWFWVLHAAAMNIGESSHAEDFDEYSITNDVGYKGKFQHSKCLDETKYVADMMSLWRRSLEAAAYLGVEDMILFPFGMGAFLRHLDSIDSYYSEQVPMRRLRKRVAMGLYEAAAVVCLRDKAPPMRLHICLVDNSMESRSNHNCFVEAAGDFVEQVPALGPLIKFHRNVDCLELARQLSTAPTSGSGEEVRKVGMLNGANNKLLGNHWFAQGARNAIDENFHRRSGSMSVSSLILNMATAPQERTFQELAKNAQIVGGQVVSLEPFPCAHGPCRFAGRIFSKIIVMPYGVLGMAMRNDASTYRVVPEPAPNTVIVDPIDMTHILNGPGGATGISGDIYTWLKLTGAAAFPDDVKNGIKEPLKAKFHNYDGKMCIHVVGPNLRAGRKCKRSDAVEELAEAYANIMAQFAASNAPVMRLLPLCNVSGSDFFDEMPEITGEALQTAFGMLSYSLQDKVLEAERIELCIYPEPEVMAFMDAFRVMPL